MGMLLRRGGNVEKNPLKASDEPATKPAKSAAPKKRKAKEK
jgi:hypothetical protein